MPLRGGAVVGQEGLPARGRPRSPCDSGSPSTLLWEISLSIERTRAMKLGRLGEEVRPRLVDTFTGLCHSAGMRNSGRCGSPANRTPSHLEDHQNAKTVLHASCTKRAQRLAVGGAQECLKAGWCALTTRQHSQAALQGDESKAG
jgi:hypothetical protein